MTMYKMPARVKIGFGINALPMLKNRVYRIIWGAISIGHIRDQYFTDQVTALAEDINSGKVKNYKQFFIAAYRSGLVANYFTHVPYKDRNYINTFSVPHKLWWRRLWTLIQFGDIEIITKENL